MTPEQRLNASIALEPVDRIACSLFVQGYAARFAGVTQARFFNDVDLAMQCLDQMKAAYPLWDVIRSSYADLGYSPSLRNRWFQKVPCRARNCPRTLPTKFMRKRSLPRKSCGP